jgi:hypothetical protein
VTTMFKLQFNEGGTCPYHKTITVIKSRDKPTLPQQLPGVPLSPFQPPMSQAPPVLLSASQIPLWFWSFLKTGDQGCDPWCVPFPGFLALGTPPWWCSRVPFSVLGCTPLQGGMELVPLGCLQGLLF